MARQDLIGALKNAIERGEGTEEAKSTLLNAGYNRYEIEEAAKEIEKFKLKLKRKLPLPPPRK